MKLIKLTLEQIKQHGRKTALIPIEGIDFEYYKHLPFNSELEVKKIKAVRKNKTHSTFIQACLSALDRGIFAKDIKVPINDEELIISTKIIMAKIIECQHDFQPELRALIDILEELYCEPELRTDIHGKRQLHKGSINFSKKDEVAFRLFCEKSYALLTYNLNCYFEDLINK